MPIMMTRTTKSLASLAGRGTLKAGRACGPRLKYLQSSVQLLQTPLHSLSPEFSGTDLQHLTEHSTCQRLQQFVSQFDSKELCLRHSRARSSYSFGYSIPNSKCIVSQVSTLSRPPSLPNKLQSEHDVSKVISLVLSQADSHLRAWLEL